MKILVFEPMKKPYVKDIKDNIHAMQEIVGGSIEPYILNQSRTQSSGVMTNFC